MSFHTFDSPMWKLQTEWKNDKKNVKIFPPLNTRQRERERERERVMKI